MTKYAVLREVGAEKAEAVAYELAGTVEAHDVKSAILIVHQRLRSDEPGEEVYRAIPVSQFAVAFRLVTERTVRTTLLPVEPPAPARRTKKPPASAELIDTEQPAQERGQFDNDGMERDPMPTDALDRDYAQQHVQ